jgi:hypothetical protein
MARNTQGLMTRIGEGQMRSGHLLVCVALITTSLPPPVAGQAGLILQVPKPPTPIRSEGATHLVYELNLINWGRDLELKAVEVLAEDSTALFTLEGSTLWQALSRPGTTLQGRDGLRVAGGMWAAVWLWVTLDNSTPVPAFIFHRVTTQHVGRDGTNRETVRIGGGTAPMAPAAVIGTPLRGGNWRAGNLSNAPYHRRGGPLGTNGATPERFAIDYNRHDEFGLNRRGDRFSSESYHAYGADVLAVADAVVIRAEDGNADNVPGAPNGEILSTGLGNWIELDLGDGRYAGYAHLQEGSVRVNAGDTVEIGEVLGLVGNSGNSAGPHLHFYVQDAPTRGNWLREDVPEGLPYAHPAYEVVGSGGSPFCTCTGIRCRFRAAVERRAEMPMRDLLVRFPDLVDSSEVPMFQPVGESRKEALCRMMEGRYLLDERRVIEAISAFSEAEAIDPSLVIPAWHWGRLCEIGSLWELATEVMTGCERAVALEPENGEWRRVHALALTLSGNTEEAIPELQRYLDWEPRNDIRAEHVKWFDALLAGRNPFMPEELSNLRSSAPSAVDWR